MINVEDYELKYNLYLAESELFTNLITLGKDVVDESVGLITIQEGVKETINKYLSKISEAIQNAWNKFKEMLTRGADTIYLESIKKKMENPECNFKVLYTEYDLNQLNRIKVIPFNYEEMKESLNTKEAFMQKYYPEIKLDDKNSSIKDALESMCVKSRREVECTPQMLKNMYRFVTVDYKSEMSKLEADLKTVNTSNKNIQSLVNTVVPVEAPNEAVVIYESYLMEADGNNTDNKDDKTSNKVEFEDQPKENNNDNGTGNNSNNKESITKAVTTYCKVSTDILTGKMKTLKDMYTTYMTIIKHFAPPIKKPKKEEKKSEENKTEEVKDIKP